MEEYVDSVVEEVAREVGLGIPDDLEQYFPSTANQRGIITTNGDVVPEGISTGDSTETLAKASVNPTPKTIDIQDSIDKTL